MIHTAKAIQVQAQRLNCIAINAAQHGNNIISDETLMLANALVASIIHDIHVHNNKRFICR